MYLGPSLLQALPFLVCVCASLASLPQPQAALPPRSPAYIASELNNIAYCSMLTAFMQPTSAGAKGYDGRHMDMRARGMLSFVMAFIEALARLTWFRAFTSKSKPN